MNPYSHLNALFSDHLNRFTSGLHNQTPEELYQPCAYILSLGGKRLRPILALVACELFDAKASLALDSALAVELFHNFSLVHDDILDEAPLRRNQATVHQKWNRNIAILSGDALLVKSLHTLNNYSPEEARRLSSLFCKTALEVCEGQQQDMNFETREQVSIAEYIEMIRKKTAVLLACSLQMGAINAGASEEDQQHLYRFGIGLGIAFQLVDDLLDAFAPENSDFGKQTGGDIRSNKKTFLLLKALEIADAGQQQKILRLMNEKGISGEEKVREMTMLFKALEVDALCEAEANRYTLHALQELEACRASGSKIGELKNYATHLLSRRV